MTNTSTSLVGRRIVGIRTTSADELENEGWEPHESVTVLELDSGEILYPSSDDEGNGPGALFGMTAKKRGFYVAAQQRR